MVGRAVATMVWSSAARAMPSMRAARITRIRRCSRRRLRRPSSAGRSHQVRHGRPPDPVRDRRRTCRAGWPRWTGRGRPNPPRAGRARHGGPAAPVRVSGARRGEADSGGPTIVGVGLADDHLLAFELLDLAGHRGGVDTEHLGQVGDPERVAAGRELVEQGGAGPVEPYAGRPQQPLVQADLGDRPGHDSAAPLRTVDMTGAGPGRGTDPAG